MPTRPVSGSVRQVVPLPPSQPYPRGSPAAGLAPGEGVPEGTAIIRPHPLCSPASGWPKNQGFSALSRAVVRSRSISRTLSGDSRPVSSPAWAAASIAVNASRSSMVETSPLAPSGSAGGAAYQPSGGSTRLSPSGPGAYMLVNRLSLSDGT
jgi:hypothetical protein